MSDDTAMAAWLRETIERELDAAEVAPRNPEHVIIIADCEAKLAILDEHTPPFEEYLPHEQPGCPRCVDWGPEFREDWVVQPWPCRTVRLMAYAYRHREGWQESWRP